MNMKVAKVEENKEELSALIKRDYDKLDSVFVRIVEAQYDLQLLIGILEESGMRAVWSAFRLNVVNDAICNSIAIMEKLLSQEVK